MPTLDQITQTGMFTLDANLKAMPVMLSLGEELVAEEFAQEINAGRISIEDAYKHFWSYVEDKELWGLNVLSDEDCRALLPAWRNVFIDLFEIIDYNLKIKFSYLTTKNSFNFQSLFGQSKIFEHYSPFEDDLFLTARLFLSNFNQNQSLHEDCLAQLPLDLLEYMNLFYDNLKRVESDSIMSKKDQLRRTYELDGIRSVIAEVIFDALGTDVMKIPSICLKGLKKAYSKLFAQKEEPLRNSAYSIYKLIYDRPEIIRIREKENSSLSLPEDYAKMREVLIKGETLGILWACDSIIEAGSPSAAAPDLIKCFQNPKCYPDEGVLQALTNIGTEEVISFFHSYLAIKIYHPYKKTDVLKSLGKIGNRSTVQVISQYLGDRFLRPDTYRAINQIHQRIKPQGYNP
jgi:hypothetical protein